MRLKDRKARLKLVRVISHLMNTKPCLMVWIQCLVGSCHRALTFIGLRSASMFWMLFTRFSLYTG